MHLKTLRKFQTEIRKEPNRTVFSLSKSNSEAPPQDLLCPHFCVLLAGLHLGTYPSLSCAFSPVPAFSPLCNCSLFKDRIHAFHSYIPCSVVETLSISRRTRCYTRVPTLHAKAGQAETWWSWKSFFISPTILTPWVFLTVAFYTQT